MLTLFVGLPALFNKKATEEVRFAIFVLCLLADAILFGWIKINY